VIAKGKMPLYLTMMRRHKQPITSRILHGDCMLDKLAVAIERFLGLILFVKNLTYGNSY